MEQIQCDEPIILSLGLHTRTGTLRDFARAVVNKYSGIIPRDRNKLLALPGLGDYSVSAIRVFAFGYNDPLIDTNTVRIISRVNGITHTDSLRRSVSIHSIYSEMVGSRDPVTFGYSILDFGAIVCRPVPQCSICDLRKMCYYSINLHNTEE